MTRVTMVARALVFAVLIMAAAEAAAKDVVIMYDTSGSMKERELWRVAIWDANVAVADLIWEGRIQDRRKVWTIEYSSQIDNTIKVDQSMLDYQGDKDKLMIVYFDEPTSCQAPFFDRAWAYSARGMGKDWPINDVLPSEKMLRGCCTFLRLAKWSAAEYHAINTLNSKTDPFFLIIVSDMQEDMNGCARGDCNCKGEEIVARKISAFEAAYNSDTLVQAQHTIKGPQGSFFSVTVYLAQVKQAEKIIAEHKVPEQDVPALATKPATPPIKVITKPPRPKKVKRPEPISTNQPSRGKGSAPGWVKYLMYGIIAVMAGSPLIYWGVSAIRTRLRSSSPDNEN